MSENTNPTPEQHHFISPSHLERYDKCPGALRLTYGIPDVKSPAGLEGTIYHGKIAAAILNLLDGKEIDETDPIIVRSVQKFKELAMDNSIIPWTNAKKVLVEHEMTVPMDDEVYAAFQQMMRNLGASEEEIAFLRDWRGTADVAIVDASTKVGMVIDWKTGKEKVTPAESNLQGVSYACMLANEFHLEKVYVAFYSPRIEWGGEPFLFDSAMLAHGKARIQDIMMRAFQPTAEFSPGQQCTWCKAKEKCPLTAKQNS